MQRKLNVRHDRLRLSRPFRISRGTKTEANVIVVSVAQGDAEGWGEGVPYARYGETIASAMADVTRARFAIEGGATREELLGILPPGAARNAIDCALWDLESLVSGVDVAHRIGVPAPAPMASALTITIDTPEAMGRAADKMADYPLLKIKVDAQEPAARINAVRAAAPDATLIVDPNESWDRDLVERMQPVLAEARVALLEQPVPANADAWLADFTPLVSICADESVHVASDLAHVAERYQAVNVKLDKAGGLTEALALAHASRGMGLGLMTGCMVSSSLSIAPALFVARMSDHVDLDGPLWLAEDRVGGVRDDHGVLTPPVRGFWGNQ